MKKVIVLMCAALAVLVSCAKENNPESTVGKKVTITAYADSPTKTHIFDNSQGGKSVAWVSGDAISLFFNSGDKGGGKFVTNDTDVVAEFTGTLTSAVGSLEATGGKAYFWGLYPYNAAASCDGNSVTTTLSHNQVSPANQVSNNLLVTIGRSENLSIYFRNTLAVVGFTVAKNDIASLTFSGNNDEAVAGEFQISFDEEGNVVCTPTENKAIRITVTPEDAAHFSPYDQTYYFAIIPGTFSKGYTISYMDVDGKVGSYSTSDPITFDKAYYTLTPKDRYVEYDYSFVDLGLSVRWATCNLGANNPDEFGLYYQWGDVYGYYSDSWCFDWSTYKWCNGTENTLTKYNYSRYFGTEDYITEMQGEDDAVNKAYKSKGRLPYEKDWNELRNSSNCSWTWTTLNGVKGYKVQSKMAGFTDKWIFLPAAGYRTGNALHGSGTDGNYWTLEYCMEYDDDYDPTWDDDPIITLPPSCARYMYISSTTCGVGSFSRSNGLSIRGVQGK